MKHLLTLGSLITGLASSMVMAQTNSPVQSPARPFGLNIVDTVKLAGSDAASASFQATTLPALIAIMNSPLYASQAKNNLSTIALNRNLLKLSSDSTVRAYFLSENTGPADSLGISTTGGGPLTAGAALIFPNISTNNTALRTVTAPMKAGDFVDLGAYTAGTQLDFFVIAGGQNRFVSTNTALNQNNTIHAVSYAAAGSTYLMLAFEDNPTGGDWDFNDVTFVFEISPKISTPEPSLAMGSMIAAISILGLRRRNRAA